MSNAVGLAVSGITLSGVLTFIAIITLPFGALNKALGVGEELLE
jgi:hypothetical protein